MRKVVSLTFFGLLIMASALLVVSLTTPDVVAFQGPPQMGPGGPGGPGGPAMGPGGRGRGGRHAMGNLGPRFFRRLADRLELSDQQLEEIEALFQAHRDSTAAQREEGRALREQLRDLTLDGAFFQNEAQVTETASALAQLHAQMTVERERLQAQIYQVLTPEQRDELRELGQLFRGFRGRPGPPDEG